MMIQSYPFIFQGLKYGDVVIGITKELIIFREQKNYYRSIPCKKHRGMCAGFTMKCSAVIAAINQGVKILKVNFKASKQDNDLHTFICNLKEFSKAVQTMDDRKELQYSLPLHEFIEVAKK